MPEILAVRLTHPSKRSVPLSAACSAHVKLPAVPLQVAEVRMASCGNVCWQGRADAELDGLPEWAAGLLGGCWQSPLCAAACRRSGSAAML